MNNKKVYVAYTGGTIGMKPSDKGFVPESGYFSEQISSLPEFDSPDMPNIEVHEYDNLIDSSNITPEDWYRISQDIKSRFDEFDGFVVLHGTDTMAYTASALSFMLEDLSKPVIVTGSQIPWSQMRTDARDNLITSLILAGNYDIPEVGLYFHNRLYRGNRSRKLDASGFHAFQSPNFPAIAEVGTKITVRDELLLTEPAQKLKIQKIIPPKVVILSLFPGFPAELLESVLSTSIKGLVLMTYGMGNAPCSDGELLRLLKQASDNGVVIVNCTQCYKGAVDMKGYETGHRLLDIGIVSGYDMTPEATLTKLSYLLSSNCTVEQIKQKMQLNLRGELSN
ncbi:asparaginase [Aliikangiella coralliicola]|uniref:asparaginase n=1 Tax=Aliikangiella coralliicola TaxID=2592383 RepID=A0A545UD38_9GAMM|nr:asparaginase [Aliikangiella coralliicola]TQV87375.1 asparaginase [Aliikangiella coralliicola]